MIYASKNKVWKAIKDSQARWAVAEVPEGFTITASVDSDGAHVYISEDQYPTIKDVLSRALLEMYREGNEVVAEQHAVCDEMEKDGKEGNRPDFDSIDSIKFYGIVYGGLYEAAGEDSHVGTDAVVPSKAQYSQQTTVTMYRMEINDKPVDFYTMAAMAVSYGIPVVNPAEYGSPKEILAVLDDIMGQNSALPSIMPLVTSEGKLALDSEGHIQSLPWMDSNPRYGHLIFPVDGQGKQYLIRC